MKRILAVLLAVMLLIAVIPATSLAEGAAINSKGDVTMYHVGTQRDNLRIHSGPGTSYKMVASIPSGTTITVDKVTDSWGRTTYNGKTGWVALWYCDPVTTSTSIFRHRSAAAQASAKESASLVSIQSDEGTSSTTNPVSWMFSYFLPSLVGGK
jgi:uncharacterized protein YgiM (DUF1202 family)